jgi:hypothetical protein
MRAPRLDALEVVLIEIARPPHDTGGVRRKVDDVLAGTTADLDHVTGFTREEFLQHRPDRFMVAMERRRIEPAIGLDPPAILAKLYDELSHGGLT